MNIKLVSIFVSDVAQALEFYTKTLGFEIKMHEPSMNLAIVVAKEGGTALMLEPNTNLIAADYQKKLYEAKIPVIIFGTDDVEKEHARLSGLGVKFFQEPTKNQFGVQAIFDDGCGNFVQIHQDLH